MSAAVLCLLAMCAFAEMQSTKSGLRWIVATLSAASAVAVIAALISSPEQWPITQPILSSILRKLALPTFVLCVGAWVATLFVKSPDC